MKHVAASICKPMLPVGLIALLAFGAASMLQAAPSAPVTIASLLQRETDIRQLPTLDDWSSNLQSSYDRTGGNDDSGKFLSGDNTEGVMADMDGPGAVVRIWSANPGGQIKIYIDGSATPVIDQPFHTLFDGSSPPFTAPVSANTTGGVYTYLPIPYAHHCKIVLDNGKGVYYHVNYLTFPNGTNVTSFSLPLGADDLAAVNAANANWTALGQPQTASAPTGAPVSVQPGSTVTLAAYHGPGVVRQITLSLPGLTSDELRCVVLRAYFDGHTTPDIEAPVSDFFGNPFGIQPFHTALLGSTADGTVVANFPMPFGRSARFTLESGIPNPATIVWGSSVAKAPFDPKSEGYFHALWSQEITTTGHPHAWLHVTGQRGKFVGVVQSMQSKGGIGYLEGDDQFRVDQQSWMPSKVTTTVIGPWNGTGTEDCFNSGWYFDRGQFYVPLGAMLRKDDHAGQIDTMRWFIVDAPTFQNSADAQIEHGGTNDSPGVYYSSVSYWYSNGPVQPWFTMPAASGLAMPAAVAPGFKVPNAIEGESLTSSAVSTGGSVEGQGMQQFPGTWSGDGQLFWNNTKVGDTLTLTITPPSAGTYDLVGYFTKAVDYGQVSFAVNGTPLSATFDGYATSVQNSGPVDLGTVVLPGGPSKVTVTVSGKNGASSNTFFGLDAFALNVPGTKPVIIPGNS
jgi:hypothetical protein